MEKFKFSIKELNDFYFYTDSKKVKNEFINESYKITKTIPVDVEYLGDYSKILENRDFLVYHNGSNNDVNIDKNRNISYLSLNENILFIPDLVYLIIGMIANRLQEKSLYFMQGAVAKYDDRNSILILGDPNAGKTTCVYKLISRYGYSLVSNDNVLVGIENGNLRTYCGTKHMQMRLGALQLHCPEIVSQLDLNKYINNNQSEWDTKIYIDKILNNMGTKYSDDSIVTDIFCVNTIKGDSYYIREKEAVDKLLLVYEHLTKQIRSNRYALTSFNYPLPSFENEKYMHDRYKMSQQIANSTPIYDAKGDINLLVKKMRRPQ